MRVRGESNAATPPHTLMAGPHHRGRHHHTSKLVRQAANRNRHTICWACGRTLADHPHHRNGTPPKWQAGHTIDSSTNPPPWLNVEHPPPPGAWLAPEASTCNTSRGAANANRRRGTGYSWP